MANCNLRPTSDVLSVLIASQDARWGHCPSPKPPRHGIKDLARLRALQLLVILRPTSTDLQNHRLAMATTLLDDGFYGFDLHDENSAPLRMDEYSVDSSCAAMEDRTKKISRECAYRRDRTNRTRIGGLGASESGHRITDRARTTRTRLRALRSMRYSCTVANSEEK